LRTESDFQSNGFSLQCRYYSKEVLATSERGRPIYSPDTYEPSFRKPPGGGRASGSRGVPLQEADLCYQSLGSIFFVNVNLEDTGRRIPDNVVRLSKALRKRVDADRREAAELHGAGPSQAAE
jgi:hypothetical protein